MAAHKKIANPKVYARMRRKQAVRQRIKGTPERPRLSVFRSLRFIYVQAIDDTTNKVLASTSDAQKDVRAGMEEGLDKKKRAKAVGEAIGKKLLALDIKKVVFDRNGYLYHGRVKELAEGAREAGLEF